MGEQKTQHKKKKKKKKKKTDHKENLYVLNLVCDWSFSLLFSNKYEENIFSDMNHVLLYFYVNIPTWVQSISKIHC